MKFLAILALVAAAAAYPSKPSDKKLIYFTADDGPGSFTGTVLDAAKRAGVPVTFFVLGNSFDYGKWWQKAHGEHVDYVWRAYKEGHLLADHSIDHMNHNSDSRSSHEAYLDVEADLKFFGRYNAEMVVEGLMRNEEAQETMTEELKEQLKQTIAGHARMPYTNNWRADYVDRWGNTKTINRDCVFCTTPAVSGENGVEIADRMYEMGTQVYGWDVEWHGAWGQGVSESAESFFAKVKSVDTALPGKVMILTHDANFGYDEEELYKFFMLAKSEGYEFRTVDTYGTD